MYVFRGEIDLEVERGDKLSHAISEGLNNLKLGMYRRVPRSVCENEKRFHKEGHSWAQTKGLDRHGQMGKGDGIERCDRWEISQNYAPGIQPSTPLRTPHSSRQWVWNTSRTEYKNFLCQAQKCRLVLDMVRGHSKMASSGVSQSCNFRMITWMGGYYTGKNTAS